MRPSWPRRHTKHPVHKAWTRISAMRLIRDSIPALQSLSQGKLTLSNASLLQENKKNIPDQNFDQILKLAEEKIFSGIGEHFK